MMMNKKIKYLLMLWRNYLVKVKIKGFLEKYPFLFLKIQNYRHNDPKNIYFDNRIVGPHCELIIDGFPRSGNSFCVKAFKMAQSPNNIQVGHHNHSYASIKYAVELGLPTLILIRNPYDAIISFGAFSIFQLYGDKDKYASTWKIKWDIEYYIIFYLEILKLNDNILIAPFHEAINDFGVTIKRFNKKFKTKYKVFNHSKENENTIFENSWSHLSPSNERDLTKPFIKKLLEDKECEKLLEKADEVYKLMMARYIKDKNRL